MTVLRIFLAFILGCCCCVNIWELTRTSDTKALRNQAILWMSLAIGYNVLFIVVSALG